MLPSTRPVLDAAGLRKAAGTGAFDRGARYARQGSVVEVRWEADEHVLHGRVRGSGRQVYSTTAQFSARRGAHPAFGHGRCTCPVGINCKHVVALVLTAASAAVGVADAPAGDATATGRAGAGMTVATGALTARARPGIPTSAGTSPPSAGPRRPMAAPAPPVWARAMGELLDGGSGPAGIRADGYPRTRNGTIPGTTDLAIELSLTAGPAPGGGVAAGGGGLRVSARLVKQGKAGGWVNAIGWDSLAMSYRTEEFQESHLRLLREMYALYRVRQDVHTYHYSHGDARRLDLSAFDSRRLWPLLDEAEAVGLRFVHARKKLGDVGRYRDGELVVDITRDEGAGALLVVPVLRIDGETAPNAASFAFIGGDGHGVIYIDRGDVQSSDDHRDWRLHIARLAEPVPPSLQRMAVGNQRLRIPGADAPRFEADFYPRLRRLARVVSSDGSFTPPEVSAPTLVLRASYGDGHELGLDWAWAYEIGGNRIVVPPLTGGDGNGPGHGAGEGGEPAEFRDVDAERAVLAALDLPAQATAMLSALGRYPAGSSSGSGSGSGSGSDSGPGWAGLLAAASNPAMAGAPTLPPAARLSGTDTLRVTTELLPLLADRPGLAVEISGEPADYREASDSVRIGLTTEAVSGETDWFDLGITISVEGRPVPFTDVFVALSRGQSHLLLADGAYFSLDKPELRTLRRLIEEAVALQDRPSDQLRISRFQAGLWDELAEIGIVDHQAEAWRQQVTGLLSLGGADQDPVGRATPPPTLAATLRPYQLEGFRWLAFLWKYQLGGVLADDMGLGKTLQTLALICHARESASGPTTATGTASGPDTSAQHTGRQQPTDGLSGGLTESPADGPADGPAAAGRPFAPFLVVAPTSVVTNWAAETARFAPGLRTATVSDTLARRGAELRDAVAGADLVVTSYTLFRLEFDAYREIVWSGLVLDEAQTIKNHQSKAYQCARLLPAPFKLAVTGTPLENNLMELWALLSVAAPGLFPSPTRFREYYARPIERRDDPELLGRLRRRIRPLMLRRTKEQAAPELPPKQEQVLEVDLHPRHRKLYQTHLQRERSKVLGLVDDMNRNRFTIFRSLTLLRQLSLHAGLVDDNRDNIPSAKIDALLDKLGPVIDGGHRALVFSQFTGFLGKVRDRLSADGVEHCYLDGTTRNRAAVLKRFKTGSAQVFLISLKAGGFGLNLTEADYCFLLDPWWNPATEAQAVDRTHRIGQTRNVIVYRLVAKDTIEAKVMALKERKAELFASVMDDGDAFGSALDAEEIRQLFA